MPRAIWLRRLLIAIGALWPAPVDAVQDIEPGRVQLIGSLRCVTPLRAPLSGRACVAFIYHASAVGSGRATTGARMRLLRRAAAFASGLSLELRDGSVELLPPSSDDFDANAHAALASMDLGGFKARERTLRVGELVRVLGKAAASASEHRFTIRVQRIEPLAEIIHR